MKTRTLKLSFITYVLISILVFATTFSCFLLSGAFFSANKTVVGSITLGGVDFRILNNFSNVFTRENNLFMPDEVISNSITVLNARDDEALNTNGLSPIFIRIRPVFLLNNVSHLNYLHIELNNPTLWVQGNDGYLYCKQALLPGERVVFNHYFVLSYLIDNAYQNAPSYLGLDVDAVQTANNAYESVWQNAPQEWINAIK